MILKRIFFRIQSPDGSNRYPLLQKSVNDTGFGYSFGSDLAIDLGENWGIGLAVDYMSSSHSVKNADRRYNGGDLIPQNYKQEVKLLMVQVSLFVGGY